MYGLLLRLLLYTVVHITVISKLHTSMLERKKPIYLFGV